jgi:hypothetical protein
VELEDDELTANRVGPADPGRRPNALDHAPGQGARLAEEVRDPSLCDEQIRSDLVRVDARSSPYALPEAIQHQDEHERDADASDAGGELPPIREQVASRNRHTSEHDSDRD